MSRTDAITDFQQFAGLRAQAKQGDDAALRKVAQQFEALFTQQLLKNMRSGELASDVMGGGQSDFYRDIFDQQMAVHLSSGKGLGLADMLVQQLRGKHGTADAATQDGSDGSLGGARQLSLPSARLAADRAALNIGASAPETDSAGEGLTALPGAATLRRDTQAWLRAYQPAAASLTQTQSPSAAASGAVDGEEQSDAKAQRFIAAIQPHAERAARELGVPAQVLMAQAALETGWGQHGIADASGKPAFNFFGIKADKSWQGSRVQATTGEYRNGGLQSENAQFRAYESPAHAFDDYVDFLKSNPRYAQALRSGGDAAAFAYGLQNAGYATDPAYAQKLLKVANSGTMRSAVAQLPRRYAL
ncbi:flagellar protein FlgJ [Solimonas aquatica]|uniref:Peptidoglycan hydrolase FlgJ n=1 Tax=Solimonas aquatica TaxID=489703 RepID=A0A1H9DZN9_9GAMM|nr:flagellar assembly peptidoglycan hydrolase FlgJ [Solimonas aquatica]SEQ18915.1 flagellar protein FlgJ [Solimonas aquatica]